MFFTKRKPPPYPSWLKWLLIAFVLYGLVLHYLPEKSGEPSKIRQSVNKAGRELSPSNFIDFSEYKAKIFPSYIGSLHIKDIRLGSGLPAVCGQEAVIAYSSFIADGKPGADSAATTDPLRFVIGEGKASPVFEQGVIGMQPGGSRSLVAPYSMAYGHENLPEGIAANTPVRFEINLLGVSPELPNPDTAPYRIGIVREGTGEQMICGKPMHVHVTVWNMEGGKIYSSPDNGAPLRLIPGVSEVFVGLEQGIIGMRTGEMRMLVVPPAFQKPLRKDMPGIAIPLPHNQTVLVDVEAIP